MKGDKQMSLQRRSKWMKHSKPIREKGATEKRRQSWAELFAQLPTKQEKREIKRVSENKKRKSASQRRKERNQLRSAAYRDAEERDSSLCRICGRPFNSHHHIIRVGTRLPAWLIERKENVTCLCDTCHVYGPDCAHSTKGKGLVQTILEKWQEETYPEYVREVNEYRKIKERVG